MSKRKAVLLALAILLAFSVTAFAALPLQPAQSHAPAGDRTASILSASWDETTLPNPPSCPFPGGPGCG
jgi:hypothetical protein